MKPPGARCVLLWLLWQQFSPCHGANDECRSRDYGHGSTVCVCDATHCDTLPPIDPPPAPSSYIISSDKAGRRWDITKAAFTEFSSTLSPNDILSDELEEEVVEVRLDTEERYQTIIGFGGAFTDAAGLNILSLPLKLQDTVLRAYYAPEGLQYTMGRVPIGGTDFSTHPYTYDDLPHGYADPTLLKFALAKEDLSAKIPMIRQALRMSPVPLKLFGSAWGAPGWMKDSGSIAGKGKIFPKYYETWAQYHIRFLQGYAKHNITFWGLTTQNEPTDGLQSWFEFNAVGWTPKEQAQWVGMHLGPALEHAGLGHLKVMVLDDNRIFLPKWVDEVMSNPAAAKYVSGVAVHWYIDWLTPPLTLDLTHQRHPKLFILYTEACTGQWPWQPLKVVLGSWPRAESYAANIIQSLNHWSTGWTDWNLALDEKGGPNWVNNNVDAPIIVNASAKEVYKQPMYYALAHFTKLLVPGSVRVKLTTTSATVSNYLSHTAFIRPDNATVVIFLNKDSLPRRVHFLDPRVGSLRLSMNPRSLVTITFGPPLPTDQ
ncbi:lysosomal acid glucosylceramidase-like isoform X1 [Eriocheir sinensis]|uniref:lysosomal acid glucosylceramidase-like isoform X1 n=2 Tax=Eriocheir sinensis TaxID=95602 RepID=UPI0021CA4AD8|nr:lysosomal acid glucosylceramidase-like isoform X1 [Eriocheir sinensis]